MVNNRALRGLLLLALLTILAACTGRETVEGSKIYAAGKEYYSAGLRLALSPPFPYIIEEKPGELSLKLADGDAYINENFSIQIKTIPREPELKAELERVLAAELEAAADYEERSILQPITEAPIAGVEGVEAALLQVFNLNNEFIKTRFLLLKRGSDNILIIFTSYNQITPDFNRDFELIKKSIKIK